MKTKIFGLLAILLCLMLAACSGKPAAEDGKDTAQNTTADEATSQTEQEADVGTMLDKPEKELTLEKFFISATYPDDENESGVKTLELGLDDTADPGILYVTDGVLKLHENIYELSSSGKIAKYTKDVFAESFAKDTESSEQTLKDEVEVLKNLLLQFGYGFAEAGGETKYKKCDDAKILLTGEAYKYELYQGEECIGSICVDKKTGIFVKATNPAGETIMTVTAIQTEDFELPAYQ